LLEMRFPARVWVVAVAMGLTGLGYGIWQLAAQDADEGGIPAPIGTVPYAEAGATLQTVDGHVPPPVASATAAPDLSNAVGPDEARSQLDEVASVAPVLRALDAKESEALLALVKWVPQPCGSPHGQTNSCPTGTEAGTELMMVDVGDVVPFWVTADSLGPMLEDMLAGDDLRLHYAASDPEGTYYLGLEGTPRPARHWGSPETVTGMFLIIGADPGNPLQSLSPLTPEWTAVQQAGNRSLGYAGQTILTFSTPTPW
jgi:hypothetical protein